MLPQRLANWRPKDRLNSDGQISHIKGKPSHKIVSDGECQFSAL